MFGVRSYKLNKIAHGFLNLTVTECKCQRLYVQTCYSFFSKQELKENPQLGLKDVNKILEKYLDKIQYCSYIEREGLRIGYRRKVPVFYKNKADEDAKAELLKCQEPLPLTIKYLLDSDDKQEEDITEVDERLELVNFPFDSNDSKVLPTTEKPNETTNLDDDVATITDVEIKTRLHLLKEGPVNWMTDYDNYNDTVLENDDDWTINYGTPDPRVHVSDVPCGGCGALLHCKDTSIPGYIPSEIYKNFHRNGGVNLKQFICQRCYFLNNYNCALQVRVAADDYPRVLKTIEDRRRALVILMVDLLDFPCSIWPGIADLLGPGRPVFVVGNKVDLLPEDGRGFLARVAHVLENSVRESGFATVNIKGVSLISAKTGFGIEDLITKLFSFWKYQGDVFLVGCTNVGKSSLFNTLLQSDYCKSQASDLIQRATTSLWPGTTLNLLKFPITRPTGWKLFVRSKRLSEARKLFAQESKLRKSQLRSTKDVVKYATLIGHLDKTFPSDEPVTETQDPYSVEGRANSVGKGKFGINEKDAMYALNKWCYDTPGVIQHDQIIHLLTTDELMLTLPKELLRPQTYRLGPGSTIFIAGLARLDYVEGDARAWFTLFCSSALPITICKTDIADEIYEDLIGSDVFGVPINNAGRLKLWPGLQHARDFSVTGVDSKCSSSDIVLSNAGWIAVTTEPNVPCKLRTWTPEKRGVHLRDSLLPRSVSLRGKKNRHSPAYKTDRFYVNNK